MKHLQWQVTLRNAPELYYNGRGDTPEEALEDLKQGLTQGLRHAVDQSAAINRTLSKLEEVVASITLTEPETDERKEKAGEIHRP